MSKTTRLEKLWEKMADIRRDMEICESACEDSIAKSQIAQAWADIAASRDYIKRAINTLKRKEELNV